MAILTNRPFAVLERVYRRLLSFVRDEYGWKTPEELLLFGTATLVGLGTGLGAVIFIWLLGQVSDLTTRMQGLLGGAAGLLLAMAMAGLIVGFVIDRWASEAKGHGVPEVMEAVALRGGAYSP